MKLSLFGSSLFDTAASYLPDEAQDAIQAGTNLITQIVNPTAGAAVPSGTGPIAPEYLPPSMLQRPADVGMSSTTKLVIGAAVLGVVFFTWKKR